MILVVGVKILDRVQGKGCRSCAKAVDNFLLAIKKFGFGHFPRVVKMLCGSIKLPCASGELGKGVLVAAFCPALKSCACVEF